VSLSAVLLVTLTHPFMSVVIRLFELSRATCFSRLRPAGIGWVDLGRGVPITRDLFPQAAHRVRATLTASGSPRGHAVGVTASAVQGEGMGLPRNR
jgi:hypothetical protein